MAAALEPPKLPADSGSPVRPNMATTSAPNPGTADSPAMHVEAPEGLSVQGPLDYSMPPEVGKQAGENLPEDNVILEVQEAEN